MPSPPTQCESCEKTPAATTVTFNDGAAFKICWLCFKPANILALAMKAVTR